MTTFDMDLPRLGLILCAWVSFDLEREWSFFENSAAWFCEEQDDRRNGDCAFCNNGARVWQVWSRCSEIKRSRDVGTVNIEICRAHFQITSAISVQENFASLTGKFAL